MVAADMVATKREALAAAAPTARWCSPSAAATSCSATATSSATSESRPRLADLETVREPGPRLIGNVAIEADLGAAPR